MKIGDELILTGQWRGDEEEFEYRSKVVDIGEDVLYIDYPTDINTKRTVYVPIKEPFYVKFIKDAAVFQFQSHVVARTKRNVPVLKIAVPSKDEFKKIQRRAYLRVTTSVDIAIHCPENTFSPFTTVTKDLSGGGARFIIPYHLSQLNFVRDQPLLTYLVLRFSQDHYEYIETEAHVVRVLDQNEPKEVSIKFEFDDRQIEQNLVQYCFHVQREERRQML